MPRYRNVNGQQVEVNADNLTMEEANDPKYWEGNRYVGPKKDITTPSVRLPVAEKKESYELTTNTGGKMTFDSKEERDAYYQKNKQYWNDPNPTVTRYGTDAEKPDPIAAGYDRLTQTPDREALRAQAIRDVQSQLDAQTAFYAAQRKVEQERLNKVARLRAKQVSALGLRRGLAGSSVAEAEKSTQAEASAEQERLAMAQLAAQEAAAKQSIIGGAQQSAESSYASQLKSAQEAELKRLEYLAGLKPAEQTKGVEVGGNLVNPLTGEVIYQGVAKEAEAKTYTLSPGQRVYDASGKLVAYNPESETSAKTISVGAGETIIDASGRVIYSAPAKATEPKGPITLSPGQTLYDPETGKPLYTAPEKGGAKAYTLSPGEKVVDEKGNVIADNPVTSSTEKLTTVSAGQSVIDSQGNVVYQGGSAGDTGATKNMADALEVIRTLKTDPGFSGAVGSNLLLGFGKSYPGTASAGFLAQLDRLKSLLTLDNLKYLKGLGAMSDREFNTISSSVAALNPSMSEQAFRSELERIEGALNVSLSGKAEGTPTPSGDPMKEALSGYPVSEVLAQTKANGGTGTFIDVTRALGMSDAEYVALARSLGNDPARVQAEVYRRYGIVPKADGGTGTASNKPADVRKIMDAIGQFESGGKYNAVGRQTASGDRAYGKYQVMGNNIPSWTKEALGKPLTKEQFLADPSAQDAVAEYKMGQYLSRYGTVEDVASVWFSGRPVAKAGNAKDVLGTTTPVYVKNIRALYDRA